MVYFALENQDRGSIRCSHIMWTVDSKKLSPANGCKHSIIFTLLKASDLSSLTISNLTFNLLIFLETLLERMLNSPYFHS